ncbi:hypothetical protein LSH36_539g00057 [Paralvinella palmiformis]|uniref:Uncharacterized protein n=1 Tax=Paralvinella palmiformis TaxID=53620 RepID=A0AAD9MXU1_9ANNE|nr:hypothetical protein LSH36_539g00057 [Paralvinella palmiformis]
MALYDQSSKTWKTTNMYKVFHPTVIIYILLTQQTRTTAHIFYVFTEHEEDRAELKTVGK